MKRSPKARAGIATAIDRVHPAQYRFHSAAEFDSAAAGREIPFELVEPDGSRRSVPVAVRPVVRLSPEWTDIEKHLNPDVPEPLFRRLDGNYACRYLPGERAVYIVFNEVRSRSYSGSSRTRATIGRRSHPTFRPLRRGRARSPHPSGRSFWSPRRGR